MRVLARLAATLARADLALHDDRTRGIDEPGARERQECQDRRRRVAPGARHELRRPDVVPVQLRDPVHGRAEQLRVRMVGFVPGAIDRRVAQPVIRREVHDQRAAGPELGEAMGAVRQREEHDIAADDVVVAHELE